MVGLIVGVFRMMSDFSQPAPLCMEEDERPWMIADVHYMYFAAFLFWLTGLVAFVVSITSEPDEDFRTIRTVVSTKHRWVSLNGTSQWQAEWQAFFSKKIRPDEAKTSNGDDVELRALNRPDQDAEAKAKIAAKEELEDVNKSENSLQPHL